MWIHLQVCKIYNIYVSVIMIMILQIYSEMYVYPKAWACMHVYSYIPPSTKERREGKAIHACPLYEHAAFETNLIWRENC